MDIRTVLKNQHHASLAMLKQAMEECPEDLWIEGDHPRSFWRIAYHTLFYTHLYLHQKEADFEPWEHQRAGSSHLWGDEWTPETRPDHAIPYTKEQLLSYWQLVDDLVDEALNKMDLETKDSGFSWYSMPKLDHQIVNIRHIQQHSGQLSELLMARGIDTNWFGDAPKRAGA